MARPQKEGLDYFPLDVDMDDKVKLIDAKFGVAGFGVLIKVWQIIYDNGYYINWTERELLLYKNRINADINLINDVINECLRWGIFNKDLYDSYSILTSSGIQKRYIEAVRRRTEITLVSEYFKAVPPENYKPIVKMVPAVIVTKTPVNANINPQSKVQYSKVKNSTKDPSSELSPDGEGEGEELNNFKKESAAFKAAYYLRNKILENNPRARVPTDEEADSLIQKWALEMDRLNRLGPPGGTKGYTWHEIKALIDFCMDDSFWRTNILSPVKLREKVVTLENKMKERLNNGTPGGSGKKDSRPGFKPSQHDWENEPDKI